MATRKRSIHWRSWGEINGFDAPLKMSPLAMKDHPEDAEIAPKTAKYHAPIGERCF